MKCPNCGVEVHEEDKFCGECGEDLRREIEIAPKWKWGSMIASLAIVFFIWSVVVTGAIAEMVEIHMIWGIFAFPAIIYLMYKERTEKIKYGLIWILLVVVLYIFEELVLRGISGVILIFYNIPAFFIDLVYVYKTSKRK